ncbi:hypothetical protein WMW72_08455 [Paenibacillus filicis]|uniref:Beta-lactamase n=1 Tax=Paenibacillus filicis TaxID=669464 RepID=A0ABU9DGD7_9BACL
MIDKGGVASGFQSHLWLLPEQQTGLFVALNSTQNAKALQSSLFESFMNHYFPPTKQSGQPQASVPSTKEQLARLEGVYRDLRLPMWHYDIVAHDGGLTVTDGYGEHHLTQLEDLLFIDENGRKAGFKEREDGTIAYFSYNKADSWSEKLPERQPFADVPDDHPYARFIRSG